jgi:hypothetical protein
MKQYSREDGLQCLAIQFIDGAEANPSHVFQLLTLLNDADLNAIHVKEEVTDEWREVFDDEGDAIDVEQVVIPEHIEVQQSKDQLFLGDYIVKRDGDTYVMDRGLFESVWSEAITENMDEWRWEPAKRLPYAKRAGLWIHKRDEDVVSVDGGMCYFRMSERPLYAPYGQLYKSAVPILHG